MGLLKTIAIALAASGLASADGLHARAKALGKYMGTEYNVGELSDRTFMGIANNLEEFGSAVPGNEMKWDATEPSRGQFSYTQGDRIANNVISAGQFLRCHTLVWHNQLPNWVRNGGFNNATLISVLQTHIRNVVTHWKGKCGAWDVVNEALNEDGSYRPSTFYNTIGEAFIPIAFKAAAAADPNVKLYYNDYNIELAGAKSNGAQRIVRLVKAYGGKIDAVGMQAHLVVGQVPSWTQYQANMNAFINLGVEVAYTELDIRIQLPTNSQKLQQQATDYGNVIKACANTPKCVGVTMWGLSDKYSWVPGTFPGTGDALPWSNTFQKKPAYNAILSAWASGPTKPATTTTTFVTSTSTKTSATFISTTSSIGIPECAALWGQCGGEGYTGPTCCYGGATCTYSNQWYSQCL